MTTDLDAAGLARLVAAEADASARRALIQAHAALVDAHFMEALAEVAPDRAADLSHEAMSVVRPHEVGHLQLVAALLEARQDGRLDEAMVAHTAAIDRDFMDTLLSAISDTGERQNQMGLARLLLELTARLMRHFGFGELVGEFHLRRSSLALLAGDDNAADHSIQAGLIRADGKIRQGLLVNAGLLLYRRGEYGAAIAHYRSVLAELTDPALKAGALSNLALAHSERGEQATALGRLEELAVDARCRGDHDLVVRTLGNMANLYGRLGRFDDELRVLTESLGLAQTPVPGHQRDWLAISTSLFNLALFHLRRGQAAEAQKWSARYEQSRIRAGLGEDLLTKARLDVETALVGGDWAEAWTLGQSWLARLEASCHHDYLALMGSCARAAREAGALEDSVRLLEDQLRRAEETGHGELMHAGLGHLALSLHRLGRFDEADGLITRMFAADAGLRNHMPGAFSQFTVSGTREQLYADLVVAVAGVLPSRQGFRAVRRVERQAGHPIGSGFRDQEAQRVARQQFTPKLEAEGGIVVHQCCCQRLEEA